MLDLQNSKQNSMVFYSRVSQSKIQLFYEDPTPEDVIVYKNKVLTLLLEKPKDLNEIHKLKLETGKEILTGIRNGDLCFGGKRISSDEKNSEEYRADWRDLLAQNYNGVKLIMSLVDTVFGDDSVYAIKDESLPFEKSSDD